MIAYTTKNPVVIDSKKNISSKVRAFLEQRITYTGVDGEELYKVKGSFYRVDENGKLLFIELFEKDFTYDQVDMFYDALSANISSENFTGIYDEFAKAVFLQVLVSDGNWSLKANDWE